MGYVALIAPCFLCGKMFGSNPDRVPRAQNEPICPSCIEVFNSVLVELGLEPLCVPSDAYKATECL